MFLLQSLTRNTAIEVASTVKALHNETESLLLGRVSLVSSGIDCLLYILYIYCRYIMFWFDQNSKLYCFLKKKRKRVDFSCFWQQLDPPEEEQLSSALQSLDVELSKLGEIPWLYHILQPNDEEVSSLCSHFSQPRQVCSCTQT